MPADTQEENASASATSKVRNRTQEEIQQYFCNLVFTS